MHLFLLLQTLHQGVPLRRLSLDLALAGGLGLRTLGVHLLLELPLTGLLGLGAVDVLNQGALVLEGVTLGGVVQLVVKVLVDLAAGTVLDQEAAEDTLATHPEDLLRHTGIGSTLPLSETTVATNSSGEVQLTRTGTRVHGDGLSDDEAIGNELADRLAGVGVGDLVDLVGVEPNLALTAAEDIGREALLGDQVDHLDCTC